MQYTRDLDRLIKLTSNFNADNFAIDMAEPLENAGFGFRVSEWNFIVVYVGGKHLATLHTSSLVERYNQRAKKDGKDLTHYIPVGSIAVVLPDN